MAFLTIVTPWLTERGIGPHLRSIRGQSDKDYDHVIIADEVGRGYGWTAEQLRSFVPTGDYVQGLDADDVLLDHRFIEKMKDIATNTAPDVIVNRVRINTAGNAERIVPADALWEQRDIEFGQMSGQSVVVKRDAYLKHSQNWRIRHENTRRARSYDYPFLVSLFSDQELSFFWNDEVMIEVT